MCKLLTTPVTTPVISQRPSEAKYHCTHISIPQANPLSCLYPCKTITPPHDKSPPPSLWLREWRTWVCRVLLSHQDIVPPCLLRLLPPGSSTLADVLLSLGRPQSVQGARRMESVHQFVAHNRNEGEQLSEPVHATFLCDPGKEALKTIPTLK